MLTGPGCDIHIWGTNPGSSLARWLASRANPEVAVDEKDSGGSPRLSVAGTLCTIFFFVEEMGIGARDGDWAGGGAGDGREAREAPTRRRA